MFAMFEKRKSRRTRMILPVKLGVGRTTILAHTIDISRHGAKIRGFRESLQIGTTIELQRGSRKAKFEIKWISQLGPNELQAGLESAESLETFWGVDLSERERESKKEMDALMALLSSGSKKTR
jgi:PilZ domain